MLPLIAMTLFSVLVCFSSVCKYQEYQEQNYK